MTGACNRKMAYLAKISLTLFDVSLEPDFDRGQPFVDMTKFRDLVFFSQFYKRNLPGCSKAVHQLTLLNLCIRQ